MGSVCAQASRLVARGGLLPSACVSRCPAGMLAMAPPALLLFASLVAANRLPTAVALCAHLPCSLPFPKAVNEQLNTHPGKPIVPKCLQLVHNTRVCRVRVDTGRQLLETVLPLIAQHHPGFADDIVLYNFGCVRAGGRDVGTLSEVALWQAWSRA